MRWRFRRRPKLPAPPAREPVDLVFYNDGDGRYRAEIVDQHDDVMASVTLDRAQLRTVRDAIRQVLRVG